MRGRLRPQSTTSRTNFSASPRGSSGARSAGFKSWSSLGGVRRVDSPRRAQSDIKMHSTNTRVKNNSLSEHCSMTIANECNVPARFATEPQRPVRKHVVVTFSRVCLCRHYFATESCDVQWPVSARVAITQCRDVRIGTNLNDTLLRFPRATASAPRDTHLALG